MSVLLKAIKLAHALDGLELPAECEDVVRLAQEVLDSKDESASAKLLAHAILAKAPSPCEDCKAGLYDRRELCAEVVLPKGTPVLHCTSCGHNKLGAEVSRAIRKTVCPLCGGKPGASTSCTDAFHMRDA